MIDNKSEIQTSLFALEKELNDLKSAKQQIHEVLKISNNVVEAVANIQEDSSKHIERLNKEYDKKILLIDDSFLKTEQQLKSAIDNVEANSLSYAKELKKENSNFIKIQNKANDKLQNEFIESSKQAVNDIVKYLSESVSTTSKIYEKQNTEIDAHIKNYDEFLTNVQKLIEEIGNVDFPNRLDKLDNTISGINIGIQNLQTKLGDLERSMKKDIEKTNKNISSLLELVNSEGDRVISTFSDKINELAKKNSNQNKYILIIVVISFLISLAIAFKMFL